MQIDGHHTLTYVIARYAGGGGTNHQVWIPFHFLPGNLSFSSNVKPDGRFIYRLVCKPDSAVARDMLRMVATHL
ncbi:DUF6765 family protein [Vibrio parahaemolyticus]|uniref:DUF6765 family protein n=1 Tax=Vibrio parahaemolyticus TaxID=670 RepID=UPI002A24B9A1|nr:DUF6765 family protein [Vibrio parahaemolyticus]